MADRIRWNDRNGFVGKLHLFRISSGASIPVRGGYASRLHLETTFPRVWLNGEYRTETLAGGSPDELKPVAEAMLIELTERLGVEFKEE